MVRFAEADDAGVLKMCFEECLTIDRQTQSFLCSASVVFNSHVGTTIDVCNRFAGAARCTDDSPAASCVSRLAFRPGPVKLGDACFIFKEHR
jgi:hypothetical protein